MNKRAITPVIATVLLLMMTVAAAGAAYFWITTIQSRIQGQIGTQASDSAAQNKQIQIISVECGNASPHTVNATIINTGSLDIEAGNTAVTIIDNQGRVQATNVSSMNALARNNIATISFVIGPLTATRTYGVKITIPGGAEQSGVCVSK